MPTTDSYIDPLIETLMEGIDQLHSQKSKADALRGVRENILRGFRAGGIAPIAYLLEKKVMGTRDGVPVTKSTLIRDPDTFTLIQTYLERRARIVPRRVVYESMILARSTRDQLTTADNRTG
jgi:hypothetical protein